MLKKTLDKSYYYDALDKLEDIGFSCEYIFQAFLKYLSGDDIETLLNYFIKDHDIEEAFTTEEEE